MKEKYNVVRGNIYRKGISRTVSLSLAQSDRLICAGMKAS